MNKETITQRIMELKIQLEKATHEFCALQGRLAEANQLFQIFEVMEKQKENLEENNQEMPDATID